ncbi:substrate-binding domain-containing protein [Luteolibacter yonseiensis]|uniref:Substrate-binding domain-containing protein n=1 Tax=Luteolibacter yonseiensis TaxID=1144680 RepID=A0A934R4P3_9BACT|nr:substrate-binding domain-containing protein [Luteolibacter yonseiensis]MBK1815119.1 substrate-binding domain-containing protein [Luteolibacter yonseiensis]
MSISSVRFNMSSPLRIGVLLREEYLKSRRDIMDGVINYCLENSGLMAFFLPLKSGEPPSPALLSKIHGFVTWAAPGDRWLPDMWSASIPVVNCNDAHSGAVPCVSAGNTHEIAGGYLKSLERRTIGCVTTSRHAADWPGTLLPANGVHSISGNFDIRVFTNVSRDPGRFPEHMLCGEGEEELEEFLRDLPKPASLWCVHDEMAALVWRKADELGIHVPNEIAIVGFGDHPCAVHSTPGITTLRLPGYNLGYEAAKRLHHQFTGTEELTATTRYLPLTTGDIIERFSTGGYHQINRGMQRAWRLLEEYPDDGLTVEHLIEHARISRAGFYKEFEKAFNISPGKAIRNSRIKKARKYLLNSNIPISVVGKRCAFHAESEFCNFFKRETGETPMEWRNNHLFATRA